MSNDDGAAIWEDRSYPDSRYEEQVDDDGEWRWRLKHGGGRWQTGRAPMFDLPAYVPGTAIGEAIGRVMQRIDHWAVVSSGDVTRLRPVRQVGKAEALAAPYRPVTPAAAQRALDDFRAVHPATGALWENLDKAADDCPIKRAAVLLVTNEIAPAIEQFLPTSHVVVATKADPITRVTELLIEGPMMPPYQQSCPALLVLHASFVGAVVTCAWRPAVMDLIEGLDITPWVRPRPLPTFAKVGKTPPDVAQRLLVMLDGVEQKCCSEADTQAGYVVCYVMQNGYYGGQGVNPVMERIEGKVEFRWRQG